MRWLVHAVIMVALTALTQVGGVIYAATLWGRRFTPHARTVAGFASLFVAVYVASWLPIEKLAALTGRVSLPCLERDALPVKSSLFSCVLHRHYAKRELVELTSAMARAVEERFPGTLTRSLDGSFPFLTGYPLLPHLSHDDGEKLDIAFYYAGRAGYRRGDLASPLGYWSFEAPRGGETHACSDAAGLRWDMTWFAPFTRNDLVLDELRTRFALRWLAREGPRQGVGKVFVEPHLARRLGVAGSVIRFQGCNAARHDDHIHIQLR